MAFRFAIRHPGPPTLEDRAIGAYLGVAVGDALGATVEFMTPSEIRAEHGVLRDIKGGGWLHLKRGAVTDDTQMTLALGSAILASGGVETLAVAQAFSTWMHSKPADIGGTVRRGIAGFRRTGALEAPPSEYAAGNGACMRTLPIALALLGADAAEVREASRRQAHITHNNPVSDAGTECVIAMVQAMLSYSPPLGEGKGEVGRERAGQTRLTRPSPLQETERSCLRSLAETLAAALPVFRFDGRRQENPSAYIVDTLKAVFQALLGNASFEDTLIDVVNRGGDADTTGAIAGMIAGALYGRHAIPRRWLRRLDPAVREACELQAQALLQLGATLSVIPAQEAVKELVSVLQAATDGPSFDKLRMRMSLI